MYTNVCEYISHLLLLSVKPQNVTRTFLNKIYSFYKYEIHFCFVHIGIISIYNTEGCTSANRIIFLDYLTAMKIVVTENFDFQYSKNFLRITFFGIGPKIGTDLLKHIILKLAYQISELP